VTVKGGPRTGLVQDDVFYFGNLVGETGDCRDLAVGPFDWARTRGQYRRRTGITTRYDHNRDGVITLADQSIVRGNVGKVLERIEPLKSEI
jgi:hypothetical protein